MPAVRDNKPLLGDPLESAHAALPAGAIEGELYIASPTSALGGSAVDGGVVPAATHTYKYTFAILNPVTDQVLLETDGGTSAGSVASDGSDFIDLNSIATSTNTHVNARRIYRGDRLVGTIYDNITTTFRDNAASTAGQPSIPTSNNTGQTITGNAATGNVFAGQRAGTTTYGVSSRGALMLGHFDLRFPFGFQFTPQHKTVTATPYTVPSNFYGVVLGIRIGFSDSNGLQINGDGTDATFVASPGANTWLDLHNPIILDAGWTMEQAPSSTTTADLSVAEVPKPTSGGFLTPTHKSVTDVSTYTVPSTDVLVILGYKSVNVNTLQINTMKTGHTASLHSNTTQVLKMPIVAPSSSVISCDDGFGVHFWGYRFSTSA